MTTSRGFTLIEAVIYIALFSLLMGSGVIAAFNLFEAASRGDTYVRLQAETDFLDAKLRHVLYGTPTILEPTSGSSDHLVAITASGTHVVVARSGTDIVFSSDGDDAIVNGADVTVTELSFSHDTNDLTSVTAAFTLAARAPSGALLYRHATTTVYLHN